MNEKRIFTLAPPEIPNETTGETKGDPESYHSWNSELTTQDCIVEIQKWQALKSEHPSHLEKETMDFAIDESVTNLPKCPIWSALF